MFHHTLYEETINRTKRRRSKKMDIPQRNERDKILRGRNRRKRSSTKFIHLQILNQRTNIQKTNIFKMETRNSNSQDQTKRTILQSARTIDKVIICIILLWLPLSCTNTLFIVKGDKNHVKQKAEQTTETKVDSITTTLNTK